MNLLFICSRNQWRSPTAENIFNDQFYCAKSAGTSKSARIKVNEKLINWADIIFVMEKKHRQRLLEKYEGLLTNKTPIVLDISDNYQYMDEELINALKVSVQPHLDNLQR